MRGLRFRAFMRGLRVWRSVRARLRDRNGRPPAPPLAGPEGVNARLAQLAASTEARVCIAARHVESGETAGVDESRRVPLASTAKVLIAMRVLARAERGDTALDAPVVLGPRDVVAGSGLLGPRVGNGLALPSRWLLELMMTESDNTASDALLSLAGGIPALREYARELGLDGISVDRPLRELVPEVLALAGAPGTPEERRAAARAWYADDRDSTTPTAMVQLLASLATGKALRPASTAALLGIMRRCATGPDRLAAGAPAGALVAHKTGALDLGMIADVGIIGLPGDRGTVAIAAYVMGEPGREAEYGRVIAEAARVVCDCLGRRRSDGRGIHARASAIPGATGAGS